MKTKTIKPTTLLVANGGEEAKILSCKVITKRELLPDVVGSTNTKQNTF